MVNAPQESMLFLLNSESFILIRSFPNNNWNPVCNKLHWNNTSSTVWGHALHSHKWKPIVWPLDVAVFHWKVNHICFRELCQCHQWCNLRLGGLHCGRILTSVVVNWSRRKSRSSSSVSRLRDAVERFFSSRAWASSMSYSNMTFACEEKTSGWEENAKLHLINSSMNKVHKTALFGFILEIKCSLRILTPNHRQTLSVGGTDALQ